MAEAQSTLERRPATLKDLLAQDGYRSRFNAMLGARAPQFMSSILNVASATNFQGVEPRSILAAAAVAATLDLPIDKNLGFAYIVPYNTQGGGKLAQFQIGWKGIVQLALRSGQYAGMNAFKVNKEALGGFNKIGDPVIIWDNLDETKPAAGYAFAWELVNGFHKIVYWPKQKVEAHALKYSQAYRAKGQTPWKSNFDEMALKTLVKNSLTKWGVMSVEMRVAAVLDQTAAIDIGAEPVYLDNGGATDAHVVEADERRTSAAPANDRDALLGAFTEAARSVSIERALEIARGYTGEDVNDADDLDKIDESNVANLTAALLAEAREPRTAPPPTGDRGRLEDAFNQLKEATDEKTAKDTLELVARVRTTAKVPDDKIAEAIAALVKRAKQSI